MPWLKLFLLLLWIVFCFAGAFLSKAVGRLDWRDRIACACYRFILKLLSIRLTVNGGMANDRPLLLVSNHVSYLDIFLLGAQGPIRFMPKSEIAKWPLVGAVCRACDCVFIERKPESIRDNSSTVQQALKKGEILCLFPEGTTGDGIHLRPFKSSFFAVAEKWQGERPLTVQPVALRYTHIRQLPLDRAQWPDIAWYGDMELLPHLLHLLKLGTISAELTYLPTLTLDEAATRKTLAEACRQAIAQLN